MARSARALLFQDEARKHKEKEKEKIICASLNTDQVSGYKKKEGTFLK
jgi:hypothetical protein